MVVDLSSIWNKVGNTFLGVRCLFEQAWIFYQEEKEESLKNYTFVLILNHLEGEK